MPPPVLAFRCAATNPSSAGGEVVFGENGNSLELSLVAQTPTLLLPHPRVAVVSLPPAVGGPISANG